MEHSESRGEEAILKYIYENHSGCLRDAPIDAANYSDAGASRQQIELHIAGIKAQYRGVLAKVRQQIQSLTLKAQDEYDREVEMELKQGNERKLAEAREEKRLAQADLRKISITYDWQHYRLRLVMEGAMFAGEIFYNTGAFTVMGSTLLFSIMPALVVSISLCSLAIFSAGYLKNKQGLERRKAVKQISWGMAVVFVALALLRSLSTIGDGTFALSWSVVVGAVVYTILGALIFVAAVAISSKLPTKEELRAKAEFDRLTRKMADVQKQIDAYESVAGVLNAQAHAKRKERIDGVGAEVHFSELITSLCEQTIHLFFKEYFHQRPSNGSAFFGYDYNVIL